MGINPTYLFKIATLQHEIEQIHQLNYETFVEEIPQHQENKDRLLIDAYHKQNTYLIALVHNEVIGMLSVNHIRPFSLDKKLGDLSAYLPIKPENLCEVRLLSVKKEYRKTKVFVGLMQLLLKYCLQNKYDAAVISGTLNELKLYKHMGFTPFAHIVGTKTAAYQPMYVTTEWFKQKSKLFTKEVSFLPGPVKVNSKVMQAFTDNVISHRDHLFYNKMKNVQQKLCQLTSAKHVQVLLGSGTLANDCVASQLQLLNEKGLILSNGEFGERLISRAERFQLHFNTIKKEWGQSFTAKEVQEALTEDIKWIWFVNCETSTGMLNSIDDLSTYCRQNHMKLIVDGISSIGAIPVDLTNVYFATGVSGKGIGSITGLSFVFHHHKLKSSHSLPPYLDLGEYMEKESVPYSHSSHLVSALEESLQIKAEQKFFQVEKMYQYVYESLIEEGFHVITESKKAAFTIITVQIDSDLSTELLGDMMKLQGYVLQYESKYLIKRNWIQIATIGNNTIDETKQMMRVLFCIYRYMKQHEKNKKEVLW
ncbi:aminotransferase class V-fold PLP-dependent enzyme [Niallia sp. 01092]|uniref:aminotransferase class V-fold PLP-dependent enzyme n=1 Tax=unclassified Niallia TaxID=2837522 RepID=UPI003FD6B427